MRCRQRVQGDEAMRVIQGMSFEQKMDLLLRIRMEQDPQAVLRMLTDAPAPAVRWRYRKAAAAGEEAGVMEAVRRGTRREAV